MSDRDHARAGQPPVCAEDFARLAADRLPAGIRDFVDGGSGDESVQAANRAALDRVRILPRALSGVADADPAARLVAGDAAMPVAVAPMAYQRLLHPDGELAAARAAAGAGVPYVISTLSSVALEDIAAAAAPTWFQLYWLRDRALVLDLVRRAETAGCEALMVTVDVPVMGRRLRDLRNGFALPDSVSAANLGTGPTAVTHTRHAGRSAVAAHTSAVFDPALSWADLEWLRAHTELPLVVKGVLDPRDAARAAGLGADAVVVSNHGGRQFAGAVASITALPLVRDAVPDSCAVLLDSGIRTGTDVLRALVCGADGVLYGRPVLWGLAADGEKGVSAVLGLLRAELQEALVLSGCPDLAAARGLATVRA
uniref:FMN-dependent dehydrogenase n=1 Tax=Streptomyces violaceusniger TaxID=68280 RepID=A0A6F8Z219_STRVO|nr:FMN-dependent dehydrogenase [Streptomyces violaceusniger]